MYDFCRKTSLIDMHREVESKWEKCKKNAAYLNIDVLREFFDKGDPLPGERSFKLTTGETTLLSTIAKSGKNLFTFF